MAVAWIAPRAKVRPAVLAADLVLGRDNYALRYIKAYRARRKRGE